MKARLHDGFAVIRTMDVPDGVNQVKTIERVPASVVPGPNTLETVPTMETIWLLVATDRDGVGTFMPDYLAGFDRGR